MAIGSYWVEFDRRGRLVTSSYDGYVRLYDAQFKRIAKRKAPGGERPFAVRFSPDGALVAVGFYDTTAVNVLAGEDLSFRYAPDTSSVANGNLISGRLVPRWSAALCRWALWRQLRNPSHPAVVPGRARARSRGCRPRPNTIMDLRALADGRLVFGAADPAFGVFDAMGAKTLTRGPVQVDYRGRHADLRLSHDGSVVEFAYDTLTPENRWTRHSARVHLAEGRLLVDPPALATGLASIQRRLAELGYDPGPADGRAGPRTRAAIQAFQRARGLLVDGEPSPGAADGAGPRRPDATAY